MPAFDVTRWRPSRRGVSEDRFLVVAPHAREAREQIVNTQLREGAVIALRPAGSTGSFQVVVRASKPGRWSDRGTVASPADLLPRIPELLGLGSS